MPPAPPQVPLDAYGQPPMMTEAPTPENIAEQINPKFLNDASLLGDLQVFDAAAIATLAKPRALREIFQNYAPALDVALDKLGRALILLYTQTRDIRTRLGDEAHQDMVERTRDVFQGLGALILKLREHGDQLTPSGIRPM